MAIENYPVRALRTPDEIAACARLLAETFYDGAPADAVDAILYHIDRDPDIKADGLRAVFGDDNLIMAMYVVHTRRLCIGPSRLPVHCIGGVAVRPDARKRGLGSVLMQDSLDHAQARGIPLLLLTGIPNYYHRFDYVSVMPETQLFIGCDDIRRLPNPGGISVRAATVDDAPQILDIYRRHMHPVLGSFDRTVDEQRYFIERPHAGSESRFLLASDRDDNPTGYLLLMERDGEFVQRETAAGDWPTVVALLQAHEACLPEPSRAEGGEQKPGEVCWQAPARSHLYYALIDHIPCRAETFHHPNADWMARLGDVDAYMRAMMPAWQMRLTNTPVNIREKATLTIAATHKSVQIADREITLLNGDDRSVVEATIRLSPEAAAQLTFGFRPPAHIAARDDVSVPPQLVDLLATLFPQIPAGVAGSDYF